MKRRKVQEFIVDETLLKVGNQYVWVWVAIEPLAKVILGIRVFLLKEQCLLLLLVVAKRFLKALIIEYGKHPLSTDMVVEHGTHKLVDFFEYNRTSHIHSLYEREVS